VINGAEPVRNAVLSAVANQEQMDLAEALAAV
jgi:hypothetical protein